MKYYYMYLIVNEMCDKRQRIHSTLQGTTVQVRFLTVLSSLAVAFLNASLCEIRNWRLNIFSVLVVVLISWTSNML